MPGDYVEMWACSIGLAFALGSLHVHQISLSPSFHQCSYIAVVTANVAKTLL